MFEAIEGTLKEKEFSKVVVQAGGIYYRILTPLSLFPLLPPLNSPIFLYLSSILREESHTLYGFFDRKMRSLFETLLNISGIGPKTSLAVVGHLDPPLFDQTILRGDVKTLSQVPGLGKKTAERVIVEMKGKIDLKGISSSTPSLHLDAVQALLQLGYSAPKAHKAVEAVMRQDQAPDDLSSLVKIALQQLQKG